LFDLIPQQKLLNKILLAYFGIYLNNTYPLSENLPKVIKLTIIFEKKDGKKITGIDDLILSIHIYYFTNIF